GRENHLAQVTQPSIGDFDARGNAYSQCSSRRERDGGPTESGVQVLGVDARERALHGLCDLLLSFFPWHETA
ncbi:hypothetical protein RA997_23355, partial [Mycobacteroides abscessus subsp. abscessus]|uniref:hypothetical protein n=1 Tax=Mycobacteroides abscessus TaxID=36809 RepID=UPI003CEDF188